MSPGAFPVDGVELTHLLVVRDLERSRWFYRDVLGASEYREYGGTSSVLRFQGAWLLLVTGGPPTPDKPTVTFAPPEDPDRVSHELTLRVPDCRGAFETLKERGAEFLTPPVESDWEIRAFFATRTEISWRSARRSLGRSPQAPPIKPTTQEGACSGFSLTVVLKYHLMRRSGAPGGLALARTDMACESLASEGRARLRGDPLDARCRRPQECSRG